MTEPKRSPDASPEDAPPVAPLEAPTPEPPSVIADPSKSPGPGTPPAEGEPPTVSIPKSRLVDEAGAFLGVSPATAAGALASVGDDETLTVNAARKALAAYGVEL